MADAFAVAEVAAQPAITVRVQAALTELPQHFDQSYGRLFAYLSEQGQTIGGAPFAVYHTMDGQDVEVEIGLPVASPLPGQGQIQASELPARRVVAGVLTGPYDQLPTYYEQLLAWCAAQGLQPALPSYEFYISDPSTTPTDALQTRVEMTLAPLGG